MPTGLDIFHNAATHIGEPYRHGSRAPCGVPWAGPWECGSLATHAVHAVTGRLWGCVDNKAPPTAADAYSGAWARDALANPSRLVSPTLAPGGAILIRAPHPDAGVGGHVAIADGKGGTVEAYSSARGVIPGTSTGRRWDWALLVPGVEYAPWTAPVPRRPILRHGSRGDDVRRLQAALGIDADGIYGRDTTRAVVAWQDAHGLTPDGEVGPLTWAALFPQD